MCLTLQLAMFYLILLQLCKYTACQQSQHTATFHSLFHKASLNLRQGDQIGRIFAIWANVYFG
jgi:hypothetical protein